MNKHTHEMLGRLEQAGISRNDAYVLRRIAMTLHRWHEMECGDSNDYASWTIARGVKTVTRTEDGKRVCEFTYDDNGKPYIERHVHSENKARYEAIPDRERGAQKRLAKIMANYPQLRTYVQTDPRGASLYILTAEQVNGCEIDQVYSRGIAVYK